MSVLVSVNHVRKALYPIFVLATVLGVQMFEYRVAILNYIHFIVTWVFYMSACSCIWISTDFVIVFSSYTYQFIISANAITSLIATGVTFYHKKNFHRVVEDLSIINTTFEVLGILNGNLKLKKLVRKVIVIWCITVVHLVVADASWMIFVFGKEIGPFVFLIVDYPCVVNTIMYIICCLILSYTKSRFGLLNEHLEKLTQVGPNTCWNRKGSYEVTGQLNPIGISKRKRAIWSLMHIHAELCRICRALNTIFGVQITFEIATYFVSVCSLAIYLCEFSYIVTVAKAYITNEKTAAYLIFRLIMTCSWSMIYIGRLILFNHICETTSTQAHKTGKLMHCFLNSSKDSEVQAEVRQFVLYMINRPLKFHGAGFFYFGYNFVYMFFTGIVTVLVIVLQSKAHIRRKLAILLSAENVTTDAEILSTKMTTLFNSSSLLTVTNPSLS